MQGVMVDVWWGIVEREGPGQYDFAGYRDLFERIRNAGLEIQAVMSFHAAGTNVGDTCTIPLPRWVLEVGDSNPDIFYTDAGGWRNRECLSLGCFQQPVLFDRTPMQVCDACATLARQEAGRILRSASHCCLRHESRPVRASSSRAWPQS
jgi:beta-amylase